MRSSLFASRQRFAGSITRGMRYFNLVRTHLTWILILSAICHQTTSGQMVITIRHLGLRPLGLSSEDLAAFQVTYTFPPIYLPQPIEVYVVSQAIHTNYGLVMKIITNKFQLSGTTTFSAGFSPPVNETFIDPRFENDIRHSGLFPDGDYELVIEVYDGQSNSLLASGRRNHTVRYPQLRLVMPVNEATIVETNPILRWTMSLPLPDVGYALKICEIMPEQNKYDAMNNIVHYEDTHLSISSLLYPLSAKSFESGKMYCWQVKALVRDMTIAESEIWIFRSRNITDNE